MIANLTKTGWEVIYHRAHALLAAQIAGHWHKEVRPERLVETVAAISHHDDLEREWEGEHITPAGAPLDFTLIDGSDISVMRNFANNARYRGRWVALLISMHLSFLTEGKRGESAELDSFLDEQTANQNKWIEELNISHEEAQRAYAFFQLCDRLSLILCKGDLPVGVRALEIGKDFDGQRYDVLQREDSTIYVTPWPFESDRFTVNLEASCLNQLKFENSAQLAQALQNAPVKELKWTFVK